MSTDHIDPFAPADSAQHPANHGAAPQAEQAVTAPPSAPETPEEERARLEELYGPEHAGLLINFGTPEERADGAELVPSQDLLARADVRGATVEFPVALDTGTPEAPKRPAKDARRDEWVDYAKALDPDLTDEDLKPITVPGLREMTALQDGTAQADA